jgi:mannose/fructose/N-acetylgalactosamine-specific phosphotransferase system component IID
MWYIATIILAVIGSFVAWAGEPMGAILFIPMIATGILYEIKEATNEKKQS